MIGGFVLLAALAIAGWVRHPSSEANAGPYAQPAMYAPNVPESAAYVPAGANAVANDGTPCVEPVRYTANERGVRTVNRTADRSVQSTRARVAPTTARKKRSTAKSVAIVAGSAGTGAAIGALAGGGKGAGIGALAGGAAGFVYDRLTHNK